MSDDSSDSSEVDTQPSGSRNRYKTRNSSDPKRKQRRIVMRIEFDDSDESSSATTSEHSSEDEGLKFAKKSPKSAGLGEDDRPSCSQRGCGRPNANINDIATAHDDEDSDEFQYNAAQRRARTGGGRRVNTLDVGTSDGSTSGSEITKRKKTSGKSSKKYIVSEEEHDPTSPKNKDVQNAPQNKQTDDAGFTSDCSSNEHLEKCPICLLSYRQQEIGSPSACQHIFCVNCIEAWSKNVQTCPIDRLEFDRIIVRESYENRKIIREINVDPNAAKELILDDEDEAEEDVTNCEVCNRPDREDIMLLCDHCNQGYHMDCLSPPLSEVPDGSWYCDNCVDSEDDDDDEEDLNMLYEDIRDMGIPQSQLRVREIQQPRILRTRQNERIRAAIMRHTRPNVSRVETTTITTTTSSSQRGRPRTTTSTTTTRRTTTNASRSAKRTVRKTTRKRPRRRRGGRQRTYVVEYDVNNFDEKFAIKATKKVIRRRRRRRVRQSKKSKYSADGVRMTASKRLAEQLGVKPDPKFTSHLSGSGAGLSLTGGANDLEYFSDSDNGGIESEIHIETGQGTAVQTSVRISNYGSQRSRKGLLLGRIRPNHRPEPLANRENANADILSSIMDMQDRWHSASRNLESVHINTDGTLNLPAPTSRGENQAYAPVLPTNSVPSSSGDNKSTNERNMPTNNGPGQNDITQAPMYSRGGGNTNFGGGSGGNYNNRYGNNNQNNYRGGGNQYRASTGGTGSGFNMSGGGNFNFNNSPNFNNQGQPPNSSFTPFRQWNFNNQRNQQNEQNSQNNNLRNSLPFTANQLNNNARPQQQQLQHQPLQQQQNPFSGVPQQPCFPNTGTSRQNQGSDDLFGGLPPPVTRQISGPMVLSVPPPPTPPAMMVPPAAALFNISTDYGRDDDSNCPNFAIYSQESQEVAKSSEAYPEKVPSTDNANEPKEDDENEDLVQLDDDEEVPVPSASQIDPSDLYEPENPTEEVDEDDDDAENNDDDDTSSNAINQENVNADDKDKGDESENEKLTEHDKVKNNVDVRVNDNVDANNVHDDAEEDKDYDDDIDSKDGNVMKSGIESDKEEHIEKEVESECESENRNDEKNEVDVSKITDNRENREDNVTDDDADNISDKSAKATKDDGDDFDDDDDSDDNEDVTGKRPKIYKSSGKDNGDNDRNDDAVSVTSSRGDTSRGHTPTIPYTGRRRSSRNPSQDNSDICVVADEIPAARISRKRGSGGNVIELYDDSDWDELNPEKTSASKGKEKSNNKDVENIDEVEPDRSYTPCLDENNDPEIIETGPESPIVVEIASLTPDKNENNCNKKSQQQKPTTNLALVETDIELIISEEEIDNNRKKRGGNLLDPINDGKSAKFKKVKKRKKRNYRNEKPPQMTLRNRFIRNRSLSRSRSRSRSNRRSRSRSRQRSILRSRSRSRSFNSFRSRSRSPRFRKRGRSNSRSSFRDKGRYGGRVRNRSWDGGRIPRSRPKRRELQRYDVRNVVGNKPMRDRYGRDTSRNRRSRSRSISRRRSPLSKSPISRSRSRSRSRFRSRSRRRSIARSISRSRSRLRSLSKSRSISRSRSLSRARNRRPSFSLSPSPQYNKRRTFSPPPRRFSPIRRRSISPKGRRSLPRRRSRTPIRSLRSRSISPRPQQRVNGHKAAAHHFRNGSLPRNQSRERMRSKSRSLSISPRYTPQVNRMRSQSPLPKAKKKKSKEGRKKKNKRRLPSISPSPNRRIARQADSFAGIEKPSKKKRRRLPKAKSPIEDHGWSPSPSPAPPVIASNVDYQQEKNVSWTPPMQSPILTEYAPIIRRSVSPASRKDKTKRKKKLKKSTKRRLLRKDKKRRHRTETPEPIPSKEVFASGNNILVSVSFNKENTTNQQHASGQQTIVTLPPNREDLLPNRRVSIDHTGKRNSNSKKQKEKRKKVESKPVAIIDLERSPFQVEQEQTDIIVLTDSEETRERDQNEHRRDRRRSESRSRNEEMDIHRSQRQEADSSQCDKSPERMETIHEESYDLPQTGPKTPPEPPGVKFNMQAKKTNKVRNPLHEDDDYDIPSNSEQQQSQEAHHSDMDGMHVQSTQKIGPNTPPESGPCSPDAYDPFEPTKSPSISPRSPTPPPSQLDVSQNTMCENTADVGTTQKHHESENQRRDPLSGIVGSLAQGASINPIDLVMALMNSKAISNTNQELANKTNDSQQYSHNLGVHDDLFRNKSDEKTVTVLSNVLLNSGNGISSPTPPNHTKKILPLPKITGSVGGSSSSGVNMRNGGTSNNADDAYTLNDADSPYSPGSDDYEDLFEPPPDTVGSSKRYSKRAVKPAAKAEMYDSLFGSSSPIARLPSYTPSKKPTTGVPRTTKTKASRIGASDYPKLYDDLPNNSALDLKERFMRKLNRQERVVEEVKLVLKPRYNKKQITKEDYKEIMRRAVPKICHSRSGEIDPYKIKNLIDAYVKKFRAKHKKLSLVSTGQVSSAVKCAAYLKKL